MLAFIFKKWKRQNKRLSFYSNQSIIINVYVYSYICVYCYIRYMIVSFWIVTNQTSLCSSYNSLMTKKDIFQMSPSKLKNQTNIITTEKVQEHSKHGSAMFFKENYQRLHVFIVF